MKTILLVFAHMDDEVLTSYGLMRKFADLGYRIYILTFCGSSRKFSKSTVENRKLAYEHALATIPNINIILKKYADVTLTKKIVDDVLYEILYKVKPELVITHSRYDNHIDHRIIAEESLMVCRLNSNNNFLKQLWVTALPMYIQTYSQFGQFQPNVFVDITKYIDDKKNVLKLYTDINELPSNECDIRSAESCITYNRQCGFQANCKYAEAYQQLFSIM